MSPSDDGPDGASCPLYASFDENAKQIATSIGARRLADAFKEVADGAYHVDRGNGVISRNWKKLARVHPQQGEASRVEWDQQV